MCLNDIATCTIVYHSEVPVPTQFCAATVERKLKARYCTPVVYLTAEYAL